MTADEFYKCWTDVLNCFLWNTSMNMNRHPKQEEVEDDLNQDRKTDPKSHIMKHKGANI